MLAKIIACQPAEPGTAQLMVRLRGEQALLPNLTFILCNNEQNYLQPGGIWSPAQHWFTVDGGYPLASGSGFLIGPTLLDPLLANASQVQIQVKLSSGETRNTTLQLVRDELLSSDARGQTSDYSSSSALTAPEPAPAIEPVVQPEPVPLPPTPSTTAPEHVPSRVPMIAAVIVVLLILAAALWWFLGRDKAAKAPDIVSSQQETHTGAASSDSSGGKANSNDCSPASMDSQNELDFVQNCVQQKLDSDKLLTIIEAAKNANKCGVAQRLYANRAQGGDSKIALAYASEYDPKYHQPSECFKEADKDTAAYWYETALQFEPNNQKAKQRLEELGK